MVKSFSVVKSRKSSGLKFLLLLLLILQKIFRHNQLQTIQTDQMRLLLYTAASNLAFGKQ